MADFLGGARLGGQFAQILEKSRATLSNHAEGSFYRDVEDAADAARLIADGLKV